MYAHLHLLLTAVFTNFRDHFQKIWRADESKLVAQMQNEFKFQDKIYKPAYVSQELFNHPPPDIIPVVIQRSEVRWSDEQDTLSFKPSFYQSPILGHGLLQAEPGFPLSEPGGTPLTPPVLEEEFSEGVAEFFD